MHSTTGATEQFKSPIYNDGYGLVDPDYRPSRPQSNADAVEDCGRQHRAQTRVLDYGGGNDMFCAALRAARLSGGAELRSDGAAHAHRPEGKFELVTCFETIEHLPDPRWRDRLPPGGIRGRPGLVPFSTLAQPPDFRNMGMNWWYVGPRNGHISIFCKQALVRTFGRYG